MTSSPLPDRSEREAYEARDAKISYAGRRGMNSFADVEKALMDCAVSVGYPVESTAEDFDVVGVVADMVGSVVRERDRLQARVTHTEQWYGARWQRLRDEFQTLGEDVAIRLSNIVANGTGEPAEPPTYAQQMNRLHADNAKLRQSAVDLQNRVLELAGAWGDLKAREVALADGLSERGVTPGRNPDGVNDDVEKALTLYDDALAERDRLAGEVEALRAFVAGLAGLEHVNAADSVVNTVGKDCREFLAALDLAPASDEQKATT